jgi:hypothetical protein
MTGSLDNISTLNWERAEILVAEGVALPELSRWCVDAKAGAMHGCYTHSCPIVLYKKKQAFNVPGIEMSCALKAVELCKETWDIECRFLCPALANPDIFSLRSVLLSQLVAEHRV